jgi:hypothetical protein
LSPAPSVADHLKLLTELLAVHGDSYLSSADWGLLADLSAAANAANAATAGKAVAGGAAEPAAASLAAADARDAVQAEHILTAVLEPLLVTCRQSAEGRLDPADTATLMANAAFAMRLAVEPFGAAAGWAAKLRAEEATWVGVLARHEAAQVLDRSGLATLLGRFEVNARHGALADQPGLDGDAVARTMKGFYASLFALAMPSFDRLQPLDGRAAARRQIAEALAGAHQGVFDAVTDPAHRYLDQSFLLHTPDQVRMLLDCD